MVIFKKVDTRYRTHTIFKFSTSVKNPKSIWLGSYSIYSSVFSLTGHKGVTGWLCPPVLQT